MPLKINANFNDDDDSFRNHRKIDNRAYFQNHMYRENIREDFANNDVSISLMLYQ